MHLSVNDCDEPQLIPSDNPTIGLRLYDVKGPATTRADYCFVSTFLRRAATSAQSFCHAARSFSGRTARDFASRSQSPALLRVLSVLEMIGTPEARQVLEGLVRYGAGGWLEEEARGAVQRLVR